MDSFMELIDIRAQCVVDDYLKTLHASGDFDLPGFEFCLRVSPTGTHFRVSRRIYSDVTEEELRPLFDNDEWERMDELFRKCVRDVLNIDVTPEALTGAEMN